MAVVTRIEPASGTDEARWAAWDVPATWPRWDPGALAGRVVVVVAAHPDDEVLGAGGLVALLSRAGARLRLVWATDGEASHPGSASAAARDLAAERRAESAAALALLGAGAAPRVHLGLPDGGLGDHEDALAGHLAGLAGAADLVVAPWSGDGHPDHEACGRAARAVSASVLEYPVWTWSWARPGDPRVPWARAVRVDLSARARARKSRAVACFATQVRPLGPEVEDGPVLPARFLAHFARDHEVMFR